MKEAKNVTDISKIDKNFLVDSKIEKEDIKFFKADEVPFKIHGVFMENGKYRRMPEKVAVNVSEGVYALHTNTAGGRVRFITDSPYVAIYTKMEGMARLPHFALTGAAGFDLYADNRYVKTFAPPYYMETCEKFVEILGLKENDIASFVR